MSRTIVLIFVSHFVWLTTAQAQTGVDSLLDIGFRYLEAYERTMDLRDARAAHRVFKEILRGAPNQPRAHLGLGLAYTAVQGQQLDASGFNEATRVTNNTLALRHLVEAVKGEVDMGTAALAMLVVTRREHDDRRVHTAIRALETVHSRDERVRAVLAEMYIAIGKPENAEAVAYPGTSAGTLRVLGIAQLLQHGGTEEGERNYTESIARADAATLAELVLDAGWLADPEEAAAWKILGPDDLQKRLLLFWKRRALRSGVTTSERLATHFARVRHAMQEFSYYRQRVAVRGAKSVDPRMDARGYHVDDRAFTYVRYGEPDERIRTIDGEYPTNESWIYRRLAERPISFDFFLLPFDAHGWTLVADVVRCPGSGAGPGLRPTLPYSEAYLRDRQQVDPRYGRLLAACQPGMGRRIDPGNIAAIAMPFIKERGAYLNQAVLEDNAVTRTRRNVPLLVDVLQFAAEGEQNSVTALVLWPLSAMTPRSGADDEFIRAKVALTVADTLTGVTVSKDTTILIREAQAAPAAAARMYITISAPPSPNAVYHISFRDLNADSVTTIVRDTIELRVFHNGKLAISDIALVSEMEMGSFKRGDRSLSLLPQGTAPSKFAIYYELYGVAPEATYVTQIDFDPLEKGVASALARLKGKRAIMFSFTGSNHAPDAIVREMHAIESEMPAGRYKMTVTVRSGAETVTRSRQLILP
ncbi:MAG: hypothetical protein ACT4O1_16845 [Gemmatimonadota bacterium]